MRQFDWTAGIMPLLAVGMALLLGAGLIWASGASVLEAYGGVFAGMCGSWHALGETGVAATPYILAGLAVALSFRGGLFNIGAEGQLYLGALGAVVVGYMVGGLPIWLHLPLALAVGALGGPVGAIPGVLKARLGTHEVITTIMMNYIALKLIDYLVKHVLRDPTASVDRTLPFLLPPDCRTSLGRPPVCTRASSWRLQRLSSSPGCSTRRRWDSRYVPLVRIPRRPSMLACPSPAPWCALWRCLACWPA
jgi:ABC-type uncharacterized transport system permease subunit